MGGTKRLMQELEAQAEWFVPVRDKSVCAACLYDEFLAGWARQSADQGECTYCEAEGPIRPVDGLLELVRSGIDLEWTCADSAGMIWDGEEKCYVGGAHDTYDLVRDHLDPITENETLLADIWRALPDRQWCKPDPYDPTLYDRLSWDFRRFESCVLHKRRFFFHEVREENEETGQPTVSIGGWLRLVAHGIRECGLLRDWAPGTKTWRARVDYKGERFATADALGSRREEEATQSNRMSPPGIPVFYGALDPDTTVDEIFERREGDAVASIGCFTLARHFRVLDLTDLPNFPSLYDPDRRKQRKYLRFLREFAERIARRIAGDDRHHIDYIPTQIVAEYFRFHLEPRVRPLDGIAWKSSYRSGGVCVALFLKNSECVDRETNKGPDRPGVRLESVEHRPLPGP